MERAPTWAEVVLIALNVGQTVALAWISSRSNRVRARDLKDPAPLRADEGGHEGEEPMTVRLTAHEDQA